MTKRYLCLILIFVTSQVLADQPRPVEITDPLPYRNSPVDYFSVDTVNPVARLMSRLDAGAITLIAREKSGYLIDLLNALDISVESQILVFSKTSIHQRLISPKNPRAIYFNDDVSVGWVPGAPLIELAAQDPLKGTIFYTLTQPEQLVQGDLTTKVAPTWRREERCLTCHVSSSTLNVPGHFLRSFDVNEKGELSSGYSQITHATPFEKRWGGWYVTGIAARLNHRGNRYGSTFGGSAIAEIDRESMSDLSPLVDLSSYPTSHSDIVALLVLDHQAHFHDLVTRVNLESRLGYRSDAEERLARYALMLDEVPLPSPVKGTSQFAEWYQASGTPDQDARSLRKLDLRSKLYSRELSPLVYSTSFRALPADVKSRLWSRFRAACGDLIKTAFPEEGPCLESSAK